jgi:hypothetical protein
MPGDAELSRHNLVFGGVEKTHHHDALMRISGEAPGRRDHSVERRKPGTSAVYRHLGSRSDIHLWLENARFWPRSNLPFCHQPAVRSTIPSGISPIVV